MVMGRIHKLHFGYQASWWGLNELTLFKAIVSHPPHSALICINPLAAMTLMLTEGALSAQLRYDFSHAT
jgi:hypothetical protein